MEGLAANRSLRMALAVIVVVIGVVLAATTGDSIAVRWVTVLLSLDVAVRLAMVRSAGA
jgi:uncharacterized membrane protein YgaE (UPF0421/DUF939 family)